jgi:hypothetical protein
MSSARGLRIIITVLAICAIAGLLVWAFLQGRKGLIVDQERDKPITAAKRVSFAHGETVITLDEVTQKISGIDTKALMPGFSEDAGEKQILGVVIPDSAVVWLDGRAWAYVQKGRGSFIRQEVVTNHPVEKGWFVTKKFQNGDRVVVQGAQLLLSEEFRVQIQIED